MVELFEDMNVFQNFQRTKEAVINILENSVKNSEGNTEILISVEGQVNYEEVHIKDQGRDL